MNKNFIYGVIVTNITLFSSVSFAKIAPSLDCNTVTREEILSTEKIYCFSEKIQNLIPEMNSAYTTFYESLSQKEQSILEENQKKWFNNIKNQSFSELNAYERREFYFSNYYQERIDFLKAISKDKKKWLQYLKIQDENSAPKIRYLEKIEKGYSNVCKEVEKFLKHVPSKIKFAKFKWKNTDTFLPYNSGDSELNFDIDNDGKNELIERYISTPQGTFSDSIQQNIIFYDTPDDKEQQKFHTLKYFRYVGAIEFFSYEKQNYIFIIPNLIDNVHQISQYYQNNKSDDTNLEYLRLAQQKNIYDESVVYNPSPITILKYSSNDFSEICRFSLKNTL